MELAELIRNWLDVGGGDGRTRTQTAMCQRANLAEGQVSAVMTGKRANPRWITIQRIAAGLGLTTEQFFAGPPKKVADQAPVGLPTSPRLHVVSETKTAPAVVQPVIPTVPHGETATVFVPELTSAIREIRDAVAAVNALTARLVMAETQREAA